MKHGYLKVAAACPFLVSGNIDRNAQSIKSLITELNSRACEIAVFPEMCLWGSVSQLEKIRPEAVKRAEQALEEIAEFTKNRDILCVIGLPFMVEESLINAAAVVGKGKVWAIISKQGKWAFDEIALGDFAVPFFTDGWLKSKNTDIPLNMAVIIGDAGDKPYTCGANLILNLNSQSFASPVNLKGWAQYIGSTLGISIVISCGSKIEGIASKQKLICECGEIISEGTDDYIICDIDMERTQNKRLCLKDLSAPKRIVEVPIENRSLYAIERPFFRAPYSANYSLLYESLIDEVYAAIADNTKRPCLVEHGNFWLLIKACADACAKHKLEPSKIAVILRSRNFSEQILRDLKNFGFFVTVMPETSSSNFAAAAIQDWCDKNNAFIMDGCDRTDYLTHKNIYGAKSPFRSILKTPLKIAEQSRLPSLDFGTYFGENNPFDELIDFFVVNYIDNKLSSAKVKNMALAAFPEYNSASINRMFKEFVDSL